MEDITPEQELRVEEERRAYGPLIKKVQREVELLMIENKHLLHLHTEISGANAPDPELVYDDVFFLGFQISSRYMGQIKALEKLIGQKQELLFGQYNLFAKACRECGVDVPDFTPGEEWPDVLNDFLN